MFIKNNSKKEWKNYNVGGGNYVDVPAESTFEVPDFIGEILLSLLGADAWLVKVDKPEKDEKPKKAEVKVDKKEKKEAEEEKKKPVITNKKMRRKSNNKE